MLETSIMSRGITPPVSAEALTPEIKIMETGDTYGRFAIEPLERGYGITVGNPMRRMLLSSIEGIAITWVKLNGILHEYSIIPHMKEEVMEFLLNVKGVRIRSVTGRPGKMRLEIRGEGRVCAGDIATSADFEIINPEFHLATLDSEEAVLSVEFNVDHGKGYQPVSQSDGLAGPLMGVLPVDAIFNPVKKVNYSVERTRVGHVTDFERLVLEVWTDGSITPVEALRKASKVLVTHFFLFSNVGQEIRVSKDRPSILVSPEVSQTPIEKMSLSPRTVNCLKRAHITKAGQVLEMSNNELLKIRNFGAKSLQELMEKLRDQDMISEQEWSLRMSVSDTQVETSSEAVGTEMNGDGLIQPSDLGPSLEEDAGAEEDDPAMGGKDKDDDGLDQVQRGVGIAVPGLEDGEDDPLDEDDDEED